MLYYMCYIFSCAFIPIRQTDADTFKPVIDIEVLQYTAHFQYLIQSAYRQEVEMSDSASFLVQAMF